MILHIDMSGPRTTAMPDDILANVAAMAKAHESLPRPERAGRSIGIVRRETQGGPEGHAD